MHFKLQQAHPFLTAIIAEEKETPTDWLSAQ